MLLAVARAGGCVIETSRASTKECGVVLPLGFVVSSEGLQQHNAGGPPDFNFGEKDHREKH